jgi:hypothetical protein
MRRVGPVVVRLTCLLFLLGTACGGDDRAQRLLASGDSGTIEGRILLVDGPVLRGRVTAVSVGTPRGTEVSATDWADSTGAYTLVVPFGRYQLTGNLGSAGRFTYRTTGPVNSEVGDTLTLWPGRKNVRADFPLGGVEIVVATPAVVEDRELYLRLSPRGRWYNTVSGRTGLGSGGEARFQFPDLCPGTYVVSLRTSWQEEIRTCRGGLEAGSGTPPGDTVLVTVTSGHRLTVPLRLLEPAVFRGKLEGAWRELADITADFGGPPLLEAWGSDSTASRMAQAEISPDGSFCLALFDRSPGPIRLAYRWGWGAKEQWIGGTTFAEATAWEIAPGREIEVSTIADAGIVLRVAVSEPLSRFPLAMTVHDSRGRQLTEARPSYSFLMGNIFVASVLAQRTVYLRMNPLYGRCNEPWIPCWYPGVDSLGQATPVSLRDGEITELETTVVRGGVIEGEFQTVPGPDVQARVDLVPATDSTRTMCDADLTADAPSFRFRGLVDGPYLLRGRYQDQSGWRRWWYPGSTAAGHADTVWVRGHAIVREVTWAAP